MEWQSVMPECISAATPGSLAWGAPSSRASMIASTRHDAGRWLGLVPGGWRFVRRGRLGSPASGDDGLLVGCDIRRQDGRALGERDTSSADSAWSPRVVTARSEWREDEAIQSGAREARPRTVRSGATLRAKAWLR